MIIGLSKEIKDHEYRVGATPAGVQALVDAGHRVLVARGAGQGAGIDAAEYAGAGVPLRDGPEPVFAAADLVCKVKEPLDSEIARGLNPVHGAVTHQAVAEAHGLVVTPWPEADRGL